MKSKKILTIVGARPQFIKAAPVSHVLSKVSSIKEIILHTGQHFDAGMSDIFFQELKIPKPSFNLGINSGHHGEMTGKMLGGIESIIMSEKPDAILVYGDTNSTVAGALAAAKLHIPICHVESGLRSFNRLMPEEINRVITDHLSHLLFCPTTLSVQNLMKEGISKGVHLVGDVMYDAVLQVKNIIEKHSNIINQLSLNNSDYGILTIHRAENTGNFDCINNIFNFVENEAHKLKIKVIFPIHPRTYQQVMQNCIQFKSIIPCEPLGYLDMQHLLSKARMVFTDSGGLQKEAYFHQVPCITLRSETEWEETINAGWNRLWTVSEYQSPSKQITDYGNGDAAEKIVAKICEQL